MTENIMTENSGSDFLEAIKQQTQKTHKALEALPVSAKLLSPEISLADYIAYLQRMRTVVADYEKHVFPMLDNLIPDIAQRRKLDNIESDLLFLNALNAEERPVFAPKNTGQALGIMYVMEGSSLGSRYIFQHINQHLGLDQNKGASYFFGYGNHTGGKWKDFLNFLKTYQLENGGKDIIAAADSAFISIYNHFSGNENS